MAEQELQRSIAQYWFEIGFGSCYAESYVRNGNKHPFELTDGVVQRAWEIAPECSGDPAEFDSYYKRAANIEALESQISTLSSSLREAEGEIRRLKTLADDHYRNARGLAERLATISHIDADGGAW